MRVAMVSHPSVSSRQLARNLGISRVIVGRRRTPRSSILINWGCSDIPDVGHLVQVINDPDAVTNSVDKVTCLEILKNSGVPTVEFTKSQEEAKKWLKSGKTVYGRELTRASAGRGIHLFLSENPEVKIPKLPLYTKFFKCDRELRVHVAFRKVIDFSEKRRVRMKNPPENRFWVRTHRNGWIYAREGAQLHENVKRIAVEAIQAVGLDFGAVDIRALRNGTCAVLEINTAPGLTGQTLDSYTTAFETALRI